MPLRLIILLMATGAMPFAQTGPNSLDFHAATVGDAPPGWGHTNDFTARVIDEGCAKPDRRCVVFEYKGTDTPKFGSLTQAFAPGDLRNQRVKFSASVKVDQDRDCQAQLWFRTDLPGNQRGFFYNMDDRPIRSTEWKEYEFVAEVAQDVARVNLGLILVGKCKAYLSDPKVEALGILEAPFIDPKPRSADAPKIEWLQKNSIPIRTIDPADDDFADLMPLKKVIGGARVVQLGEQSHGDGATFYAKERLIRFLHEQMGFDVLAWESGFFDCEAMNKVLDSNMPALEAAQRGVFGIWTRGGLMTPLFEYTRSTLKTNRPLRHTGFDVQFSGTNNGFTDVVDGLENEIASEADKQKIRETVRSINEWINKPPSTAEQEPIQAAIARVVRGLQKKAGDAADKRAVQFLIKSFENLGALVKLRAVPFRSDMQPSVASFRDIKMGENLIWLANDWYKDKKIIVWAASMHVARNVEKIDTRTPRFNYDGYRTMGTVVAEKLGESVYTIAFTAYTGRAANPNVSAHALAPPEPESLETLFHAAGRAYALVDFRSLSEEHWLRGPVISRPLGYTPMSSDWTLNFDAMIFTDVMFPNTPAGTVPAGVKTKH